MVTDVPQPFSIDVPQAELDDLRERLRRTRLFDSDLDWPAGVPTRYLRELVTYWADTFDWRAAERRLNRMPQFRTTVGDVDLHFVHARGRGPRPLPLLFTHGWPGSFWEVHKILGPLTDPGAHGGDPTDAFHVVAPSLPGYGFSPHPGRPGVDPAAIADTFHTLMTTRLGYPRYVAQGGDWGSVVTQVLAGAHGVDGGDGAEGGDGVLAIHLNLFTGAAGEPVGGPDSPVPPELAEQRRRVAEWQHREGGYAHEHSTKPLTVGHALADSPAGLAAWIVEKFRTWSDCDGDVESVFSKDELLTNITLYWLGGNIGTSIRLYYERANTRRPEQAAVITVPTALAAFPKEVYLVPPEVAARSVNLARHTVFARGGHFPALEQPAALVEDLRAFFRPYRATASA